MKFCWRWFLGARLKWNLSPYNSRTISPKYHVFVDSVVARTFKKELQNVAKKDVGEPYVVKIEHITDIHEKTCWTCPRMVRGSEIPSRFGASCRCFWSSKRSPKTWLPRPVDHCRWLEIHQIHPSCHCSWAAKNGQKPNKIAWLTLNELTEH